MSAKEIEDLIVNGLKTDPSDKKVWDEALLVYMDWLEERGFKATREYFDRIVKMHKNLVFLREKFLSKLHRFKAHAKVNQHKIERAYSYNLGRYTWAPTLEDVLSGAAILKEFSDWETRLAETITQSIRNRSQSYWPYGGGIYHIRMYLSLIGYPGMDQEISHIWEEDKKLERHDIKGKDLQKERAAIKALNGTAKKKTKPTLKEHKVKIVIKYK